MDQAYKSRVLCPHQLLGRWERGITFLLSCIKKLMFSYDFLNIDVKIMRAVDEVNISNNFFNIYLDNASLNTPQYPTKKKKMRPSLESVLIANPICYGIFFHVQYVWQCINFCVQSTPFSDMNSALFIENVIQTVFRIFNLLGTCHYVIMHGCLPNMGIHQACKKKKKTTPNQAKHLNKDDGM